MRISEIERLAREDPNEFLPPRQVAPLLVSLKTAIVALVRAGERDGRYLAVSQQGEWKEALKLVYAAGLTDNDLKHDWQV